MIILRLLLVGQSAAFFFPVGGGGGCQCATCPQLATCPPTPACAIPLPCPTASNYAVLATPAESFYQGTYHQTQPIAQSVSEQIAIPAAQQQLLPVPTYLTSEASAPQPLPSQDPTYYSSSSAYQTVQPVYYPSVPVPTAAYTASESHYNNPVQPIRPVQTVSIIDDVGSGSSQYSTLKSTPATLNTYSTDAQDHSSIVTFDDSSPALPPPVPSSPPISSSSYDYKSPTNDVTDLTIQDNTAELVPAATTVEVEMLFSCLEDKFRPVVVAWLSWIGHQLN
ncbi:hypothetical protein RB195_014424 [Necator americanus]|uniref:Uncharacterized protein n=1 Tax=Necator americanus TaxID=51031 RepID=A0ABR1E098_NECAM